MQSTRTFLSAFVPLWTVLSLVTAPALRADEPATSAPAPASTTETKQETKTETKTEAAPEKASAEKATKEPTFTGPAGEVKSYMDDLFEASKRVNSPTPGEKKSSRAKIEEALDWDAIAQECLGNAEWKRQSAGNRSSFRNLLKDVILRTAYSRMDKFWKGATASVDKIDVKGNDAKVAAKFRSNGEKMKLDYYFRQKGGKKWRMYDVAYNGQRYSVNISDQIDVFLRDKKFSELLEKLKKRRDELVTDAKSDQLR